MNFRDSVVWVAGASGALGAEIIDALAGQGAIVVASNRSGSAVRGSSANVHGVAVDVADSSSVNAAATHIVERFGRIDGLVAATGRVISGDFEDIMDGDWLHAFDAKLFGYVRLVRAVIPVMRQQTAGSIVLLSGRNGTHPSSQHLPGSTASAAVNNLAAALRRATAPTAFASTRFRPARSPDRHGAFPER